MHHLTCFVKYIIAVEAIHRLDAHLDEDGREFPTLSRCFEKNDPMNRHTRIVDYDLQCQLIDPLCLGSRPSHSTNHQP